MESLMETNIPGKNPFVDDIKDTEIESMISVEVGNDKHLSELERDNQELLDKYPEEYRQFRNKLLLEIQPKIEAEFEREKNFYNTRIKNDFEDMLLKAKEKLIRTLEENMEDEIRKKMLEEMQHAERKKEIECKRAYARIKNEVIKAKNEGVKICLHCGEEDACHSCKCNQAFYCNGTCLKKHLWIHNKLCSAKGAEHQQ